MQKLLSLGAHWPPCLLPLETTDQTWSITGVYVMHSLVVLSKFSKKLTIMIDIVNVGYVFASRLKFRKRLGCPDLLTFSEQIASETDHNTNGGRHCFLGGNNGS